MWKPVLDWLFLNYPVIIIVFIIIYISWKTFSIYNRFIVVENDVQVIKLELKELQARVRSIEEKLNQLIIYLQSKDNQLNGLIISYSPMQLTQFATQALSDYGAYEYIERNKENLLQQVKDMNPGTSLDVQNTAFNILTQQNETVAFNAIKESIYNKPTLFNPNGKEVQIDISNLNFIMAIVLRNEYLQHNPHVLITDEKPSG